MANAFETAFGIPLPKCCSLGECCKGASPSKPFSQLMKRAAEGDEFARNFFSIMVPYPSQDDAEAVVPGLVKRMKEAAKKLEDFENPDELVFYHCRYLREDNRCGVHEDRPQFCRDYPDTPFVVTAPGCAFEGWVSACKQKYHQMKDEVGELKQMKAQLAELKAQLAGGSPSVADVSQPGAPAQAYNEPPSEPSNSELLHFTCSPVVYLPGLNVGAPLRDFWFYPV